MGFNQVILWIMAIGAVIGGIDFILGNKLDWAPNLRKD